MRECPKCHYVDPPYWRNRLFDYEVDICNLEDLKSFDIDLMVQLILSPKTVFKHEYVYKLTKTGWVYRIWLPLFKVRGWNPQKYYDGSGSRASALRKVNLQAYNQRQLFVDAVHNAPARGRILDEVKEIRQLLTNLKE